MREVDSFWTAFEGTEILSTTAYKIVITKVVLYVSD